MDINDMEQICLDEMSSNSDVEIARQRAEEAYFNETPIGHFYEEMGEIDDCQ